MSRFGLVGSILLAPLILGFAPPGPGGATPPCTQYRMLDINGGEFWIDAELRAEWIQWWTLVNGVCYGHGEPYYDHFCTLGTRFAWSGSPQCGEGIVWVYPDRYWDQQRQIWIWRTRRISCAIEDACWHVKPVVPPGGSLCDAGACQPVP